MERYIAIDGTPRLFKASGATPRIYRGITGRDLMRDLAKLDTGEYTPDLLLIYEDLAYTMAKQGNDELKKTDPEKAIDFPQTPDEWLDTIEVLDVYDVMPQIAQMWRDNTKTTIESKKKKD